MIQNSNNLGKHSLLFARKLGLCIFQPANTQTSLCSLITSLRLGVLIPVRQQNTSCHQPVRCRSLSFVPTKQTFSGRGSTWFSGSRVITEISFIFRNDCHEKKCDSRICCQNVCQTFDFHIVYANRMDPHQTDNLTGHEPSVRSGSMYTYL